MSTDILVKKILPAVAQLGVAQDRITGFLAMRGNQYCGELMIVGRAVNGWIEGIEPERLKDQSAREAYAQQINDSVTRKDGNCPMSWVTDAWGINAACNEEESEAPRPEERKYDTKKSAFWRVARSVVDKLAIAEVSKSDSSWSSHLVWSNLYKIAPEGGKNPNGALCRAQFDGCVDLFGWEMKNYRPRRILFLTGKGWASEFLEQFRFEKKVEQKDLVEVSGRLMVGDHSAECVIAQHPQGKNETAIVEQIVSAWA